MKSHLLRIIFFTGLFFSVTDGFSQAPSPYYISDIFKRMYSSHEYYDTLSESEYKRRVNAIEDSLSTAYKKLKQWKADSISLMSLQKINKPKINQSDTSTLDSVIQSEIAQIRNQSDSLNSKIATGDKKKKKKSGSTDSDSTLVYESVPIADSLTLNMNGDTVITMNAESFSIPQQWLLMDTASQKTSAGKNEEAIFYYDKVIGNYPGTDDYVSAFYFRAKCKLALGIIEPALFDINKFIQLDSCSVRYCSESHYERAMIYFLLKNYESAISDFSLVAKDSAFANQKFCFFYRALCHGELNKPIQAVQDFTRFLTMDGYKTVSSAEALYYRGFYKSKLADNRGAITDYDLAVELYAAALNATKDKKVLYLQKLIDTYIIRGHAYSEIKKYAEAILNYNTVIKLKPDYAEAYHLKGLAEIAKGELDAGCLDLSKAGELGSNDAYNDIKIHCQ